jgi:hypothetical protein
LSLFIVLFNFYLLRFFSHFFFSNFSFSLIRVLTHTVALSESERDEPSDHEPTDVLTERTDEKQARKKVNEKREE